MISFKASSDCIAPMMAGSIPRTPFLSSLSAICEKMHSKQGVWYGMNVEAIPENPSTPP